MSEFKIVETMPEDAQYVLFENLPTMLYNQGVSRFKSGNDPVSTHLEGCYLLLGDNGPVGRFAFYENPELKYKNEIAACIGSYECVEDQEISGKLIQYARRLAKRKGYVWLIGPMEGSTWNNYRFSKHNVHNNFFMEPYHHIYYNQQFKNAGFQVIANYCSNRDQTLDYDGEKLYEFEKHYLNQGAVFRNLNMADLKNDLRKIARFSLDGFAENFLYTPISVKDFVAKYEKLEHFFDPNLVWIVENSAGEMQAFIFSIKDYMDPLNETMIIKSVVRRQSSPFRGIGNYLIGKISQIAKEIGYKKVVHAFMIDDNTSLHISKKYTEAEYKSYALYGLRL